MIDILGVYAVVYGLLLLGLAARFGRLASGMMGWGLSILTWALAIYTGVHRNDVRWFGVKVFDSTYVFVFAVAAGCVLALLAYSQSKDRRKYLGAVGTLAVSAAISFAGGLGDRFNGFWANPDFLIQGHAVWHAFGTVAMLAAYEAFSTTGFCNTTMR
jgi:hypothetical protein